MSRAQTIGNLKKKIENRNNDQFGRNRLQIHEIERMKGAIDRLKFEDGDEELEALGLGLSGNGDQRSWISENRDEERERIAIDVAVNPKNIRGNNIGVFFFDGSQFL